MTKEEIIDKAESLQLECKDHVERVLSSSSKSLTAQDAINVWIYLKLAQIELKNKSS